MHTASLPLREQGTPRHPTCQKTMQIVADENIPFAAEAFGAYGEVRLLSGRSIDAAAVRDADVLLVRSVTVVDEALLAGSRVRFVGSATIGTDHVDEALLARAGIRFAHAPGSNADSVVEWVAASLFLLAVRRGVGLAGRTVGIVGCGSIGSRLARRLPALGLRVLVNDPPKVLEAERAGRPHAFVPLEQLLVGSDVVTVHVPYLREGRFATHHLVGRAELDRMRPEAWLLNSSRGSVVDGAALGGALADERIGAAVLDVWEGEPTPDPELVRRAAIGTPHIAGYSYDGKVLGTVMLLEALVEAFDLPRVWDPETVLGATPEDRPALIPPDPHLPGTEWMHALVRQMYDIGADAARFGELLRLPVEEHAAYFTALRKSYPRRRAFDRHHLSASLVPETHRSAVRDGLQVQLTS